MAWNDPDRLREYGRKRAAAIKDGTWVYAVPNPPIKCAHCKIEFKRSPANRSRKGQKDYCSRECMGKAFEGRISPKRKGQFTIPCEACGKDVTRPDWMKDRRNHTFCNHTCFGTWKFQNWTAESNPSWKGGKHWYYGANWVRQQREARKRDGYECQLCGKNESETRRALDVHHIRPFRFYGFEDAKNANKLSNLITLCEQCHHHLEKYSADGTVTNREDLLSKSPLRKIEPHG